MTLAENGYSSKQNSNGDFSTIVSTQTSLESVNKFLRVLKAFEEKNKGLSSNKTMLRKDFEFGKIQPKL
jgi:hypothetical protein